MGSTGHKDLFRVEGLSIGETRHIKGYVKLLFKLTPSWAAGVIESGTGPDRETYKFSGGTSMELSKGMKVEFDAVWSKSVTQSGIYVEWRPKPGHIIVPTLTNPADIIRYLSSPVFPGIGPVIAQRICDAYGSDFEEAVRKDVAAVKARCRLSAQQAKSLYDGVLSQDMCATLIKSFPSMSNATAQRLAEYSKLHHGENVAVGIRRGNYGAMRFMYDISMYEADKIAIEDLGMDEFSDERLSMILYNAVLQFMRKKHATYVPFGPGADTMSRTYFQYVCVCGQTGLYRPLGSMKWAGTTLTQEVFEAHVMRLATKDMPLLSLMADGTDNGRPRYRLYTTDMASAEQLLFTRFTMAYNEDKSPYATRLAIFDRIVASYRKHGFPADVGPFAPSDGQIDAARMVLCNSLSCMTGGPGCGKTTALRFLVHMWSRCAANECNVLMLAPTGKAVARMKAQTGWSNASTIARFLIRNKGICDESGLKDESGDPFPLNPSSLVIVDEASMLDFIAAAKLMDMIRNCTIVFVGDKDQLPPISPGPFFREALRSGCLPIAELTENFRSAQAIDSAATKVIRGEQLSAADFSLDPDKGIFMMMPYAEHPSGNESLSPAEKYVVSSYRDALNDPSDPLDPWDVMVIAPYSGKGSDKDGAAKPSKYRLSSDRLNLLLQDEMNPKPVISSAPRAWDDYGEFFEKKGVSAGAVDMDGHEIRIGDRLMNTRNQVDMCWHSYKDDRAGFESEEILSDDEIANKGIFNGDMGTVVRSYVPSARSDSHVLMIRLDDVRSRADRERDPMPQRFVFVKADTRANGPNRLSTWGLAYAMTVHKSQGSEADRVIVAMSGDGCRATTMMDRAADGTEFLNRNLLYTAATRARKALFIVGSEDAVRACVATEYRDKYVALATRAVTAIARNVHPANWVPFRDPADMFAQD